MILGRNDDLCVERFIVGPLQTNCYLVYDRSRMEGVVIDPGWHDEDMLKAIFETKVKVRNVINTHGHADHIAGNVDFSVPIVIHRLDEGCLNDPVKNLSFFSGCSITSSRADSIVEDGDIIAVGGFSFEVLHTPGHTPGGISLKSVGKVFTGDTLFFEGIGRTDLAGGDLDTILKSIDEKLMPLSDDVEVFPGHGPGTTIGEARLFLGKEFSSRPRFLHQKRNT